MNNLNFQYCQKIIVLSKDKKCVLLCKRKGEADFDGDFSFIGGKMETSDSAILDGLKREKDEEVGKDFKVRIYPTFSFNISIVKKDGSAMILPHYLAIHESGDIVLNDEYSEFKWVKLEEIGGFEPKISTIPAALSEVIRLTDIMKDNEFVLI
jgi:8-oxo-dGTP pyrophosphatase MutT (NUDIX family)